MFTNFFPSLRKTGREKSFEQKLSLSGGTSFLNAAVHACGKRCKFPLIVLQLIGRGSEQLLAATSVQVVLLQTRWHTTDQLLQEAMLLASLPRNGAENFAPPGTPNPQISTWVTRLSDSGGNITKLKFARGPILQGGKKVHEHSDPPLHAAGLPLVPPVNLNLNPTLAESARGGLVVKFPSPPVKPRHGLP